MTGAVEILPGLFALPQRAAWVARSAALVVADVHFAFSAVERRRGTSGPASDAQAIEQLNALVASLQPREVIFLGDVAHAAPKTPAERELVVQPLLELAEKVRVGIVLGNHDRGLHAQLPLSLQASCVREYRAAGFHFLHGDVPTQSHEPIVSGHLHPAVTLTNAAGAQLKLPAFLTGASGVLLPAFSPTAGGLNVLAGRGAALVRAALPGQVDVFACGATKVVPLGPLSRLASHARGG